MIPDPRRKKGTSEAGKKPWEPVEPKEPSHLPDEPENVRSPEKPTPKRRPPTSWADE